MVVARIEQHSLMRLSAEYPSIAVAIIRELGGRLARMNRSLAYLTYAAEALGRNEYDSALLDKLTNLPGELANFGARLRRDGKRDPGQAEPPRGDARSGRNPAIDPAAAMGAGRRRLPASISMPRCTRRARSAAISTIIS